MKDARSDSVRLMVAGGMASPCLRRDSFRRNPKRKLRRALVGNRKIAERNHVHAQQEIKVLELPVTDPKVLITEYTAPVSHNALHLTTSVAVADTPVTIPTSETSARTIPE